MSMAARRATSPPSSSRARSTTGPSPRARSASCGSGCQLRTPRHIDMQRGCLAIGPAFTMWSLCSDVGIHNGNVRRRFGKIERRAARRIFLTCFGALTRVRCAALFPLRRAVLSSLGASSKKRIHNDHFRIRIAQPTVTTACLAFPASSAPSQAVPTERAHIPEITTSLRPAGKTPRYPDRESGRRPRLRHACDDVGCRGGLLTCQLSRLDYLDLAAGSGSWTVASRLR